MPAALSIRGLTKNYGAVAAAREVTFEVEAGEIFGLIGPNGAGKTTVLECISGLRRPDAGRIILGEIDAQADPDAARRKLGVQLQASALPDAMTPRQALRLCAAFYLRAARPEELIERFRLSEKADARYRTLSAGQRQRLALSLAFVNEPEIVILDEPTAGLDPAARRDLHELIAAQRAAGRALVFTTHDLEEARTLCDRIGLIDRGRLAALGAPAELIARSGIPPRVVARIRPALPLEDVRALPGVGACAAEGEAWSLQTTRTHATIAALVARVESRGGELLDLRIEHPTLDDVFRQLTATPRG